jgi:hypothetical protein
VWRTIARGEEWSLGLEGLEIVVQTQKCDAVNVVSAERELVDGAVYLTFREAAPEIADNTKIEQHNSAKARFGCGTVPGGTTRGD